MSYQVNYTSNILNPIPITVVDRTLNVETSIAFPGKLYNNPAPVVSESFLHLLENFASTTTPPNPVQGQLWYDANPDQMSIKVYDGASEWLPVSDIKKSQSPPSTANKECDLWVDTVNKQLKIYYNNSWHIVGPKTSSSQFVGVQEETIESTEIDNLGNPITYDIISFYSSGQRVMTTSNTTFTPRIVMSGFPMIYKGTTLTTLDASNTKFWGTARTSDKLNYTIDNQTSAVASEKFMRNDLINVTSAAIKINNDEGLHIGINLPVEFTTSRGNLASIINKQTAGDFEVRLTENQNTVTILYVRHNKRVGINTATPSVELDVVGAANISSDLSCQGDIDATGGISASGVSLFNEKVTIKKTIEVDNIIDNVRTSGSTIVPVATGMFDIGSDTYKFRNLYVSRVAGSADSLTVTRQVALAGDVVSEATPFNGGADLTLTGTLATNVISTKSAKTSATATDKFLISDSSGTQLSHITLSDLSDSMTIIKVGSIIMWPGETAPARYKFCDGSLLSTTTYASLYGVILRKYTPPEIVDLNVFALPDFRARVPLGPDDMGGTAANRISGVNLAESGGASEITDSVKVRTATTGATADVIEAPISLLNPYLSMNYIIYTGVLD